MDEIPLGHVNHMDLIDLVVHRDVRPERPDCEEAPQLSDAVWGLAEKCWVKDPKSRPTVGVVCDTLARLCDTAAITTLNPNSSSPQPNILPRPTAQTPAMDDSPPSTLTPPHNGSRFIDNTSVAQPKVDLSIPVVESKPLPPRPIAQYKVPHDTTSVVNPIIDSSPVRPTTPTTPTLPSLDLVRARPSQSNVPSSLVLLGHTDIVFAATFSADGKKIVSASGDHTVRVWDAQTGDLILGPLRLDADACCVAFSPDGKQIASGSTDNTIQVWDALTGNAISDPFTGHADSVLAISFSPDGRLIASGGTDNAVRIWDARSGIKVVGDLQGHTNYVVCVVFCPDGTQLISGSYDKTVRLWNVKSGRLIRETQPVAALILRRSLQMQVGLSRYLMTGPSVFGI